MGAPQPKADIFQAIADPTRRELLHLLSAEEMPVGAISGHFPISRTAVSKHLKVLSDAGLVQDRKVGRETRYRLNAEPLSELKRWLSYFDRYWENKLSVLKHYVESGEESIAAGPKSVAVGDTDKSESGF
ncbi:helix-turn-helix transcriptional regulator [Paenibacillus sp. PAMC21692]|uniref:ArsR/SmtB family transcription factor n=1 Tax=Paenibacillus sp. PAMC21692 TaxID=2762320 RepID=UPI00164D4254|nr:metalloregulator ArsR/SmtB family transcription factor [Paenibacillus sp. PAMC21692]QNK57651.1 winged helix-turn-helix transcriptional regulator [Paenibacillus sp. PAMC21692]